jgi:pyruvate, water dikinase
MTALIKRFREIGIQDVPQVGGKNASLGELISSLSQAGIRVPDGFAITSEAYWLFIDNNGIREKLSELMSLLDRKTFSNLKVIGTEARHLILNGFLPDNVSEEIREYYLDLCPAGETDVAVRSSATAEDLPNASFAGQHESYLNVRGSTELLEKVKRCYASLYTDRAIKYREDNGFDHSKIALSVGIQKMVRSDKGCSGIIFTLEPESGFENAIHISGVWGLGEGIVQGTVTPDEFLVFKPSLLNRKYPILRRISGSKEKTMIYTGSREGDSSTCFVDTSDEMKKAFVLSDAEIELLSRWALKIEQHYKKHMDIEWAKDGITGMLYIIQARPETVHGQKKSLVIEEYSLAESGKCIASGQAVGSKVTSGVARILKRPEEAEKLKEGEIVVTEITSPDWDPILKKSSGIITDKGGRTSHASIVARELGVPAIVGTGNGTFVIKDGEEITLSCCEGATGRVYEGKIPIKRTAVDLHNYDMPETTEVMLIAADPDAAFKICRYPNDGIGLMRIEFIITHHVQVHPMALIRFDQIKSVEMKKRIQTITARYVDKKEFFVDKLAEGIATLAAAFYPKDVIVRMSDFKSNEYANLIGGAEFEPKEENPMIGFRGASRYYSPLYREGFELECKAVLRVREKMGLTNVKVMIPFCRTPEEGRKVIEVMKGAGLDREKDKSLDIYVMAEIPSNVLQADEFAEIFDGFSIGSNDLTQLTLGIDRDSSLVDDLFDEKNISAKLMISTMIEKAKSLGAKIGLCGQAPSDYPEFASFLVEKGIDSISFNADAIIKGIDNIRRAEQELLISK